MGENEIPELLGYPAFLISCNTISKAAANITVLYFFLVDDKFYSLPMCFQTTPLILYSSNVRRGDKMTEGIGFESDSPKVWLGHV